MLTAFLNNLITFLAYDWFAGIDAYSYDAAGFQLLTGVIVDPYPLMFRAPLLPILKNLLYLFFEGHQILFGLFLHLLGMTTCYLAWRLGNRFSLLTGACTGMFMALSLPISVHFHHLSISTVYIPLLILTADQFIVWLRTSRKTTTITLAVLVFLCCMTRTEAVILIPIFTLAGWLGKVKRTSVAVFLGFSVIAFNLVCLGYFNTFGYWGVSNNSGYSLFGRIFFPDEPLFSKDNGPASLAVAKYLDAAYATKLRGSRYDYTMIALNFAQNEIGYTASDQLFRKAAIETISAHPSFYTNTLARLLGQMDIYDPGLRHDEYPFESTSGHMWGGGQERLLLKKNEYLTREGRFIDRNEILPLEWERKYLKHEFLSLFGFSTPAVPIPPWFQFTSNLDRDTQGESFFLNVGDCVLAARAAIVHIFDDYFYLTYWGDGHWSPTALRLLSLWDQIFPRPPARMLIHSAMWFFWLAAIYLLPDRRDKLAFLALLAFVLFSDLCQATFSDNYGRRFFIFTVTFLWLGGVRGGELLVRRIGSTTHKLITPEGS